MTYDELLYPRQERFNMLGDAMDLIPRAVPPFRRSVMDQDMFARGYIFNDMSKRAPFGGMITPPREPKLTPAQQEKKNKEAEERAKKAQEDAKKNAADNIDNNHKDATSQIDKDNKDQGSDAAKYDQLKANWEKDKKKFSCKDYKELRRLDDNFKKDSYGNDRGNALNNEQSGDAKATKNFIDDSKKAQNAEFNKDGKAKSELQKAEDRAREGFLKFLSIFAEIISDLSMLLPGVGEVLGMGLKLAMVGERVAQGVVDAVKAGVKVANKANDVVKYGDQIRQQLGMKKGDQEIAGASGKVLADMQNKLLDELIARAQKNIGQTQTKVASSSTAKPKSMVGPDFKVPAFCDAPPTRFGHYI